MNYIRPKISVCMAAYNGAKYIKEQIGSILSQLCNGDELIIVDDCSTDETCEFIRSYENKKIHLYQNDRNIGHCKSFEKAISLSCNEYIFLADQDDIWVENRVTMMLEPMQKTGCKVVNGIAVNFSEDISTVDRLMIPKIYPTCGYILELLKSLSGYRVSCCLGCAMAFHSSLKEILLPFPSTVTQHDIYLANLGNLLDTYYFLPKIVLFHRIHDKNVSTRKRRALGVIAVERLKRLLSLLVLIFRIYIKKANENKHKLQMNDKF